jgi:cyclophilin family peptidyl-prolyl cis-trans isomerase
MERQWSAPPAIQIDPEQSRYFATLRTSKGEIRVELLADEAPLTVNNFVFLAREGYYDGVRFHRIIRPFMVQTGDPTGTGSGGPGYRFADELPPRHSYDPGIVAMANAGPNTNGSQFFICSGPQARGLNNHPNYTQFGRVVEGMEVVEAIAATPVGPSGRGELSRPLEEVLIESVLVEAVARA